MFSNGPEYEARLARPFTPPTATLKQIHDAVPKHLLRRDPKRAGLYVARDICMCLLLFKFAASIEPLCRSNFGGFVVARWQISCVKYLMWCTYWWFQGLVWAGIFCLGHDAGHGTLFNSSRVNHILGFTLHTFLLIPYFSWRATHIAHHKATSSIERDENYVPYTRSEIGLPEPKKVQRSDYSEIFEETPIFTLWRMFIMQLFGWWMYLTFNTMGSKMYPPGTNHWMPSSPLFRPEHRNLVMISNVALCCMICILVILGPAIVGKFYLVPYLLTNHWIVMFTYLHHSDPTIPHYRKKEWSFLRGAAATVDRPLLGPLGRYFLHNISHDHVAHHFFITAPFFNGPQITQAIRSVLKDDYNYDSTNTLYALWRSFTQCLFIEEDGDIVFYKNKYGEAAREVHESLVQELKSNGWDPTQQDRVDDPVQDIHNVY